MNKKIYTYIFLLASMGMVGCKKKQEDTNWSKDYNRVTTKLDSTIHVQKVENLKDDFILGMDASSVISEEASGVKYYNYDGTEQDVYKTLSDSGINYIRVRIWNDPYNKDGKGYGGGNCDINTAVAIGKRATKYGMKLLVNFHYSDFWADPSKQMCPKAWEGMNITEKSEALYKYTKESLQKLYDNKIDVGMVQIGNETNGKLSGEKTWMNICTLLSSGSKAVREVYKNALVAVHFANPEKVTNYEDYGFRLNYYNVDYDVFGSSYYPYWHGTLANLSSVLSNIANKYDKKTMVLENSYAYTTEDSDYYGNTISDGGTIEKPYPFTVQSQANQVRDVIDTIANKTKNGIGYCYWEGTWISVGGSSYDENKVKWENYGSGWAASYAKDYDPNDAGKYYGGNAVDNQAFFNKEGKPLESLKVFNLVKYGNSVALKADALEDTTIICDLNGTIKLPEQINAVMNDNSRTLVPVTWNITNEDYQTMYNGGVNKYTITGTAGGMNAYCYVSMVEYNFLKNYSFEDGATNWTSKCLSSGMDELKYENKATDSLTGSGHYHFWSANSNSVEFTLEQEVTEVLHTGKYKFTISIMGGDCGTTDIYSYVKIDGVEVARQSLTITSYGNWDTKTITNIDYTEGSTMVVGIYVKAAGENNGAWGKIDDALLNSMA